jgi:tetratricopeptide (TPR) repeat protein
MTCFKALVVCMSALSAFGDGLDASEATSLHFDATAAKNRPVTKVVTLLKDMLKQLQKEADEDEDIYDKLACWCTTNDKAKTKAIKDAEEKIDALETKIAELTALSARLTAEIEDLEKDIEGYQAALDKATAIRKKELAEFQAEEKDMLEAIGALKAAIEALSKHHTSFLQMPQPHLVRVAATLQREMQKHASLLDGLLTHSQRRLVLSFVEAPGDYFDATPTFKQSYAPQSGQIFSCAPADVGNLRDEPRCRAEGGEGGTESVRGTEGLARGSNRRGPRAEGQEGGRACGHRREERCSEGGPGRHEGQARRRRQVSDDAEGEVLADG